MIGIAKCEAYLSATKNKKTNHCPNCGQKLD